MNFHLTDNQRELRDAARQFARKEIMPKAAVYDRSMEYPWDVINKGFEHGLMNTFIPEKYGGLGLSHVETALVVEQIAYGCSGIGTAMTANDLALSPLSLHGTPEQLEEFAVPMLKKPQVAGYCVTEPNAGSDVAAIATTAKRDGDDYLVNGEKMWITNASVASWYFLLATMDHNLGAKGMVCFVIPSDLEGIIVGKKEVNMGQRCSDTRGIVFKDVRIPQKYRLGAEGEGFKIAMQAFDKSRPMVAALAVGVAQCAFDHALRYAQERKAFGKPIFAHQAVAFMLADMATRIEASRLLTLQASDKLDHKERASKEASMAKLLASETVVKATQDAVQIYGGYGYNNEYPVEKLYRDAKIFQIYEGTSQIQRLVISRLLL
ncbi:MAG: acyl-CoA dehydrogenase family protein [Pseudomonadota bacterium]|nr:acyl-CoA dehydrogenase family protein [Pseudomonadota bacterium]